MGCSCPLALFLACWPAAGPGENQEATGYGAVTGEGAWVLNDRVEQKPRMPGCTGLQCEDVKPHGVSHGSLGARVLTVSLPSLGNFPSGSRVEQSACNAGAVGSAPGSGKDPPEKEVANHFRILTWKSPGPEEPCGLQCVGWKGVGQA